MYSKSLPELPVACATSKNIPWRLAGASALLGVSSNTMRAYADNAGVHIKRAADFKPGAPQVRVFDPSQIFQIAAWRRAQGYTKFTAHSPTVITVDVIKGGTGKTTTSVELAVHLQLNGIRTLLVDLDIQANATQMLGYEPDLTMEEAESYDLLPEAIVENTFASILLPYILSKSGARQGTTTPPAEQIIKKPFGEAGPHLIPSDPYLGDVEAALAKASGQRELYLRRILESNYGFNASDYDVIIFDCPPSVSFLSSAAIAAADIVVAPIRMDLFSIKGLSRLMGEINTLESEYRLKPELIILPTHYAPQFSRISRMQQTLTAYRELMAPCVISASEQFPKSLDQYMPLTLQAPTSQGSKEYKIFAEFIQSRIIAGSGNKK
ncbi:MAG: ParA family protein [Giesbergeria sp.]|nr:ParA family protein [Giesbergeria sp.]